MSKMNFLQEKLLQEGLNSKDHYLEITNLDLLNYFLSHSQKKEIKEIGLYCYGHLKESVETFSKSMDQLSISKLFLRATLIDDETFEKLVKQETFCNVRKLGLSYNEELTDLAISKIVEIGSSLGLRCLQIDSTSISDEGVRRLAFSEAFSNIKELDIGYTLVSRKSIEYLSHSLSIPILKTFKLRGIDLESSVFNLFTGKSKFSCLKALEFSQLEDMNIFFWKRFCNTRTHSFNLKKLTLRSCNLSVKHFKLISRAKNLEKLEYLDLTGNNLEDNIISDFSRAHFQATLDNLILSQNRISQRFLKALSQTKCYHRLKVICLAHCPEIKSIKYLTIKETTSFSTVYLGKIKTNEKDLRKFIQSFFLRLTAFKLNSILGIVNWNQVFSHLKGESKLIILKLNNLTIDLNALYSLFSQIKFPFIERLKISGNPLLKKEALEILCSLPSFPKLNSLDLKNNFLVDEDCKPLLNTSNFPFIKVLNLNNSHISEILAQKILKNQNLPYLECLIYSHDVLLNKSH